jgi:aryl-alcohol dehydrogenase-like predicted oxidoreductase
MTDMRYRRLGGSGLKVSVVGLGTNNFGRRMDEAASVRVLHSALDCGINFIDTADVYGSGASEEFIGRGLRRRRGDAIIATKFGMSMGEGPYRTGGSRRYIRRAVEDSLRRLNTDYIDLYQMHRYDPDTPLDETLATLDDLVHEGKVRYIGNSNFAGWQIADADWIARTHNWTPFVSAQNRYSLLDRSVEKEVIPACERFGLGMIPWGPLASGLLTGKYRRNEPAPTGSKFENPALGSRFLTPENFDRVEALAQFAQDRGVSLLQIAFGGLAAQPQVASVIAGATSPEQVEANVEAGLWEPTPEDLEEINRITEE